MADEQVLMGKWTVRVQNWIWEYEFFPGGRVTWRDTRSSEKGTGKWSLEASVVKMIWNDSTSTESWKRPITPVNQRGIYRSTYFNGEYTMQKTVGAVSGPESALNLPFERFVDVYVSCKYDLNYKIPPDKSFAYSSILQLTYNDGVSIEIDIEKDFSTVEMSSQQVRDALANATVGRGGRIFPTALNARTTPNLWTFRAEALRQQDEDAGLFMGMMIASTAVVLSVPAMPAGMAPSAASPKVSRRIVPGTEVAPAPVQGNVVRVGPGNAPGSLWASIQSTSAEVVYRVDMIVLQGKGTEVAVARATHRAMITRAAQTARSAGLKTFTMVGKQANPNFVRHADQLAREIGVPGSGIVGSQGIGYPDYTVTLDVAKALSQ
jgi:hypothetical protein